MEPGTVPMCISFSAGKETLEETIKSIMASNYRNFEVLIIDDGSTDRSLQIAKELEKKYRSKEWNYKR